MLTWLFWFIWRQSDFFLLVIRIFTRATYTRSAERIPTTYDTVLVGQYTVQFWFRLHIFVERKQCSAWLIVSPIFHNFLIESTISLDPVVLIKTIKFLFVVPFWHPRTEKFSKTVHIDHTLSNWYCKWGSVLAHFIATSGKMPSVTSHNWSFRWWREIFELF